MSEPTLAHPQRTEQIAAARRAVIEQGRPAGGLLAVPWSEGAWIERSWRRCLATGLRPQDRVAFDLVTAPQLRRVRDEHQALVTVARPVLERLAQAIAGTRYFAILANQHGVVIDAHGPIDRDDPRADLITRVGVDLSEARVGTTAIGAALAEQHPVWLHRAEHFHDDTSCYSCAGAPLAGPDGDCIGMLDLTGIDVPERLELKHLVAQAARGIENALVLARPHHLVLRLNWPGRRLDDEDDGLVGLDAHGCVTGSNAAARQLVPALMAAPGTPVHCGDLFAQPWEPLFDRARQADAAPVPVTLWSGLRLAARVHGTPAAGGTGRGGRVALRDVEAALIRQAVADARGNVMEAARALGISRATVYRKLARRGHPDD